MNSLKWMSISIFTLFIIILISSSSSSSLSSSILSSNQRINRAIKSTNETETATTPTTNKSPYWEYILRKFVFKTISSSPIINNILYKKLLKAPFYGRPLSTLSNEKNNTLISCGNIYHLSNGQWILCEDNCQNCIECINQNNSIIKWTLKKIKRIITTNLYRYDLQLTVIPQLSNGTFENFQKENYIYVPFDSISLNNNITVTTQKSHIDRSRSIRSWKNMQNDEYKQINKLNDIDNSLNYQHNMINANNIAINNRLIVGIDKSGKKHIIHITSLESSDNELNKNKDTLSYQQYINNLLESIYTHRSIIESFLSYNRILKKKNLTNLYYPVYTEFMNNDNNITKLNLNLKLHDKINRTRDWSQILTRMQRNKNYIPKLIKKFNNNITNIIRSKSITLFQ